MDSYYSELERALRAFQLLPRKLNQENILMLGNMNHVETFEEDDAEIAPGVQGKRISLSGSIFVLDLDFSADGTTVVNASVSLSNGTPQDAPFSALSSVNKPSERILTSLAEPRLDSFARLLGVLSKCDRFSTRDIDCFKALALVTEAVAVREQKYPGEYGKTIMNPPHCLGLAFEYVPGSLAFLDISPGSRPDFALRNYTDVNQWIQNGEWVQDEPPEVESRAELCLSLDPAVVVSDAVAQTWQAQSVPDAQLDSRKLCSGFSVPRHPRFGAKSDEFDVTIGNMLPFRLVSVNEIPVRSPAQIPEVLAVLKQFSLASQLVRSVSNGEALPSTTEAAELNIVDALALRSQPLFSKRIPLSLAWRSVGHDLEIDLVWAITDLQMTIKLPLHGDLSVTVTPANLKLNMDDISKLLRAGRLDLALSYTISSGKFPRRSTASERTMSEVLTR